MTLVCTSCGASKDATGFFRKKSDGYRMPCKACRSETQREHVATAAGRASQRRGSRRYEASNGGKDTRRQYEASDAGKAKARRYRKTERGRATARDTERRYVDRHPERKAARRAVYYAVISTGGIFREEICAHCGGIGNTEAHHHRGYAREFWLDVIWLCLRCHRAADAAREALERACAA